MGKSGRLVLCAALTAILMGAQSFAQDRAQAVNGDPRFKFSPDAANPIVEYTLVHHMLAEQDSQPLLRVYGDGRVHVHLPAYMKRSGDYELHLNASELQALLRALAQDGVIDFDPAVVRQQRRQLESQQTASDGTLAYVSDVTETVISVNLDEYQGNAASRPVLNMKRRLVWKNLEQDARRFQQSNALQGAAAGAQRLHKYLNHPGLKRLR